MPDKSSSNPFDQAAGTWDDHPIRVALASAIGETILREAQVSKEMDVLDYGCGTGLVSLFLLSHVRTVTVADSSTGMLDVLKSKIAEMSLETLDVIHLNLEHDAVPDKRFHMIVTAMTMHHVRNTDKLLDAFHRLLHPGGILCVADLDSEPGTFHGADTAESVHHHGFDRSELALRLENVGFINTRDVTAHSIRKETDAGEAKDYPVFLIVARRPE